MTKRIPTPLALGVTVLFAFIAWKLSDGSGNAHEGEREFFAWVTAAVAGIFTAYDFVTKVIAGSTPTLRYVVFALIGLVGALVLGFAGVARAISDSEGLEFVAWMVFVLFGAFLLNLLVAFFLAPRKDVEVPPEEVPAEETNPGTT